MAKSENSFSEYFIIRELGQYDASIRQITHHVLLFLKTCMDKHGECYWGTDSIAERTGWSKRSIQKAIKQLVKQNYVTLLKRGGKGPKDTNLYSLNSHLLKSAHDAHLQNRKAAHIKSALDAPIIPEESNIMGAPHTPDLLIIYPQGCTSSQLRVHDTAPKDEHHAPEVVKEDIKEVFPEKSTFLINKKQTLPESYQPNDEHFLLCKQKEIDIFERYNQFKAMCESQQKTSYNWDAEFKAYLLGSFKRNKKFKR